MRAFSGLLTSHGTFDPLQLPPQNFLYCDIFFSGYLADRANLSHKLSLEPAQVTDAELVAHAFHKWGRDLQSHVLGQYAAVIWDTRARAALLTHDSFGLSPLFYSLRKNGLAFASNVVDLLDAESANSLDAEYLADFLALGFITSHRTPFTSISRLLPGESLWWSNGTLQKLHAETLANIPETRCRDNAEYEEQFNSLLRSAVLSALHPSGATWVSLSGGLDSSTIASVAANSGAPGISAYSVICPKWPEADERPWMQAVVDRYELPWHTVNIEEILPFTMLPGKFHGEPTVAVIDEKRIRLQEELLTSKGARVLLSGHGGDAVLCSSQDSMPTHFADTLFDGKPWAALSSVKAWKNKSREKRSYLYWILRTLVQPSLNHICKRQVLRTDPHAPLSPWLESSYSAHMRLRHRGRRQISTACRQPGRQSLSDSIWMLGIALSAGQRRHAQFDLRAPLLYRPLVEFMCSVPWEQKLQPRCDRYLQRRALKGTLPESVRRRAGKASGNPTVVEGLRRSRHWFDYLCENPQLAELGIVNKDKWRHSILQASVGQTFDDKLFLATVVLEGWLKQLDQFKKDAYANRR